MRRFLLVISVIFGIVAIGLYASLAWNALCSAYEAWLFQPHPKPYEAIVVGFDKRIGVKADSTAPIVEVTKPNGEKFKFYSHKYSSLQAIALRERVEVVFRKGPSVFGRPSNIYEVNNTWHLWLGDLLTALILPTTLIVSVLWARLVPPRRASRYSLPD